MTSGTTLLAVIGISHEQVASWRNRHVGLTDSVDHVITIVNNHRFGGYGSICQKLLDYARSMGVETFGAIHADTDFPDGLDPFFDCAAKGDVVAGLVGASKGVGHVWANDPKPELEIHCLDGCAIFFRSDLIVDFDVVTFDGHHCCVEDLCLMARKAGYKLVVPQGRGEHFGSSLWPAGPGTRANEAWLVGPHGYHSYLHKLKAKHKDIDFQMC